MRNFCSGGSVLDRNVVMRSQFRDDVFIFTKFFPDIFVQGDGWAYSRARFFAIRQFDVFANSDELVAFESFCRNVVSVSEVVSAKESTVSLSQLGKTGHLRCSFQRYVVRDDGGGEKRITPVCLLW